MLGGIFHFLYKNFNIIFCKQTVKILIGHHNLQYSMPYLGLQYLSMSHKKDACHARIHKVLSEGAQFLQRFFLGSKCHFERAIMTFHWRADDGLTLNTSLAQL